MFGQTDTPKETINVEVTNVVETKVKRGRGRPKGSKGKPKPDTQNYN